MGGRCQSCIIALDERADGSCTAVENGPWIHTIIDGQYDKGSENCDFPAGEIEDIRQRRFFENAEDDPAIEIKRIGCREDDAGGREKRDPAIRPEGTEHSQEFTDEAGGSRKADIGHGKDHEGHGIEWHALNQAAIGRDLTRMHAVIDDADAKKEGARNKAMRDHLEDGPLYTLFGHREK